MKKIFKNMDIPLLISVIIMCIIGLMAILSASSVKSVFITTDASPYYFFKKQLVFLIISFTIGFFILTRRSKTIEKWTPLLLLGGFGLLISVLFVGTVTNGCKGWIQFPGFTIQPSEFMKLIMILFMGKFFANPNRSMDRVSIFTFLLIVLSCLGLILAENDLGTTVMLGLILFFTFITIPLKDDGLIKLAKYLGGAGVVIVAVFLLTGTKLLSEYQMERFNIKNPCGRYYEVGTGYQVCNGYIAMNNGGLFGVGLGNSTQKYLYLPEAHTDFIFPIIVEEFGVIPSIGLILFYLFILVRIFNIAKRASNLRNSIIAYGVFVYISLHFIINLGGVLSILPLTGVPLLFLSNGGSSLFTAICSIFIVERIAAESKIENTLRKIKEI